jgi:hypothetical protein
MAVVAETRRFGGGIAPGIVSADSATGVVHARLNLGGVWTDLILDDLLPCREETPIPVFATGRRNQLWPAFTEKAAARAFGSYGSIRGGSTTDALSWLTGAPLTRVQPSTNQTDAERDNETLRSRLEMYVGRYGSSASLPPLLLRMPVAPGSSMDALWARICRYVRAGHLMGAGCGGPSMCRPEEVAAAGLVSNHAYSIISAATLGGVQLLKLRNPWGRARSSLAYGPGWSGWTPATRALVGEGAASSDSEERGKFWIQLSDFVRFFSVLDVVETKPGWRVSRVAALCPSSPTGLQGTGFFPAFEITPGRPDAGAEGSAEEGMKMCVTAWQAEPRQRANRTPRSLLCGESPADDWRVPPAEAGSTEALGPDRRRPQKRIHSLSLCVFAVDGEAGDARAASASASAASASAPAASASASAASDWHRFADKTAREAVSGWPHPLLGPELPGVSDSSLRMLSCTQRSLAQATFSHLSLRHGRRYLALPLALSIAHPGSTRWTEVVCSVHAEAPGAQIRRVAVPCAVVACAQLDQAQRTGVHRQLAPPTAEEAATITRAGVTLIKVVEMTGFTYLVENRTRRLAQVRMSISRGKNVILSRASTVEEATVFSGKKVVEAVVDYADTLAPMTGMVIVVGSPNRTTPAMTKLHLALSWEDPAPVCTMLPAGSVSASHAPDATGFHTPIPCKP